MPTSRVTPQYNLFEKVPERRRRSGWSRLRHRPAQFAWFVVLATGGLMALTYLGMRFTHSLPAQRRAQRTVAVAQHIVATPAFANEVIQPLEQFLADGLPIARNTAPFANFVARSVTGELAMSAMLPALRPSQFDLIRQWRAVMTGLEQHDVRIYGMPSALLRGDTWLREFVAARLAKAEPALAHVDPQSSAVDRGVMAVVQHFGISAPELDGIVFAAERANQLRSPAVR